MRARALALSLLVAACAPDAPDRAGAGQAPPAPEVAPVVERALAEIDAALAAEAPDPAAEEPDLAERVEGLVASLEGGAADWRELALEEVRGIGDAALPHLLALLDDPEQTEARRAAAADLAAALDDAASAAALLDRAHTADEAWVRARCVWLLGQGTQDQVVPPLVLRLKYELDHETVVWMAWCLGRFGNYSGLVGLEAVAATGPTPEVRQAAVDRVAELAASEGLASGAELRAAWDAGDPADVLAPRERSARYDRAVWEWIGALDGFQLRGVDDARFLLARLDDHAARFLGRALFDSSPYVRLHAAQSLERMGPRGAPAAPALVAALASPDVGPNAATALGRVGDPTVEPELVACLEAHRPLELRVAAARGLGFLGLPTSADALAGLLAQEEAPDLRQAAAESLVYVGAASRSVAVLLELLDSDAVDPASSEAALGWWLRRLADGGSERATELLERWAVLGAPLGEGEEGVAPATRRALRAELLSRALPSLTGE